MKAVIYARYSSDTQREESIEGQIRECTEYAKYNDMEIVGQYIDRAFSAKTDDRPDFQRMIADSAKKLFDVVLVWKLDRFARNRYDSAFYRYTLRKNGVRVVSAKENISNGPEGIILESLLEGIAEFYSANLSQNVKRGFKENALKGKWNGGAVPLGYRVVDHKLEVDEATAPVVQKMFTMCADGYTAKQIYDYLREKQVRRANGKPIAYNSVLYTLSNRIYLGEYRHSGIVLEHAFPALISEEMFEKVQATIQKHSIAPAAHSENDDYLLTTHLFCGHCGAMMTAYSGTSRTGKTYRYYICNRARKHLCDKEKVEKEKTLLRQGEGGEREDRGFCRAQDDGIAAIGRSHRAACRASLRAAIRGEHDPAAPRRAMQRAGEGDREHRQRHSEGCGVGYVDRAADGIGTAEGGAHGDDRRRKQKIARLYEGRI